jgi:hypothetical protein
MRDFAFDIVETEEGPKFDMRDNEVWGKSSSRGHRKLELRGPCGHNSLKSWRVLHISLNQEGGRRFEGLVTSAGSI